MAWKIVCYLVYIAMRVLHATYRYQFPDMPLRQRAAALNPTGAFSFATWHGNSFAGTLAHASGRFSPLVSRSKDGQIVAFACARMGLRPVRGSTSRGGKEARDELMAAIADGYSPAITVDGPKGPPHRTKPGIVDIARRGRLAIVPLCAMPEASWQLSSWDRLRIPKPFTKVHVLYGEPIVIPKDLNPAEFAEALNAIDHALNALEDRGIRLTAKEPM